MDNPPPVPRTPHDAGSDPRSPPGAPRWVKVSGIIVAVVVLLVLILLLTGNNHGPGRHIDGERPPGVEHSVQNP